MLICAPNATQDEITQALKDAPVVDIQNVDNSLHLKNEFTPTQTVRQDIAQHNLIFCTPPSPSTNHPVSENLPLNTSSISLISPSLSQTPKNIMKCERLKNALDVFKNHNPIFPALGPDDKSTKATTDCRHKFLTQLLKVAKVETMTTALSKEHWRIFLTETSELNRSLQRANENVNYGCMYSRVDSLRCFFEDITKRNLITSEEKIVVREIIDDLLGDLIDQLNRKRVFQMAETKRKRLTQDISPELAANFSIFLDKFVREKENCCYGIRVGDILVGLNADMAARPSSMIEMTIDEWNARKQLENGWFTLYVKGQKASMHNNPLVSMTPESANKISFYIDTLRPTPKTPADAEFVFLTRGGKHMAASDASQCANRKWKTFVNQYHLENVPDNFCFGTHRRAIQTDLRYNPGEGRPPQPVMNNTLGHKEGVVLNHYVDPLATDQQAGAAAWIHDRSRGKMSNYKPVKPVKQ